MYSRHGGHVKDFVSPHCIFMSEYLQVGHIMEDLRKQLWHIHCPQTRTGSLQIVRTLAKHHLSLVVNALLSSPLPFDEYVAAQTMPSEAMHLPFRLPELGCSQCLLSWNAVASILLRGSCMF